MLFNPNSLPQTPFDVGPMGYGTPGIGDGLPQNQPAEAFIWGSGGAKLTPEMVEAERMKAADLLASGRDTSPVQHWTQGLSRLLNGYLGGLQEHRAKEQAQANTERSNGVLQALMGTPDQQTLITAVADPYLDAGARDVATLLLKNSMPKPINNDTVNDYNFIAAQIGPDAANAYLRNKADPFQAITTYGADGSQGLQFIRPSQMGGMQKGGDLSSGGPAVGTVEDGYRFKGGDPSKQENWEVVGGGSGNAASPFP